MSFTQYGNIFTTSEASGIRLNELPPLVFNLKFAPMGRGFFLERSENFGLPDKIYGNQSQLADRIISTSRKRNLNTGVLLSGEKGSGKTLLSKIISRKMQDLGHPTIVISEPYGGGDLNQLIEQIPQHAVVLFDEFEKTYRKQEDQEQLLTLLDGTVQSKKLYLLTSNDYHSLTGYLKNRPGRLRYTIEFKTLENDVIEDYVNQNLLNKEHTDNLYQVLALFDILNFDMLQAIVEEMNMYNETATEACKYLNTRPDMNYSDRFQMVLYRGDKLIEIKSEFLWVKPFSSEKFRVDLKEAVGPLPPKSVDPDEDEDVDGINWGAIEDERDTPRMLHFSISELKSADAKLGRYVYSKDQFRLILTRAQEKEFKWEEREKYLVV